MARTNQPFTAAERKRRAQQSAKDKANSSRPARQPAHKGSKGGRSRARKLNSRVPVAKAGVHPYTKMILDPCHAKLTPTPLPGREGSSVFRLPFRQVVTLPSSTTTVTGSSASNVPPASALTVTLTPSATLAGSNSCAVSVCCAATESVVSNLLPFGTYGMNFDPVGLGVLDTSSSQIRPVAACLRLEFYSGTNTGSFMAYEGAAGDYVIHKDTTALAPATNSQFVPNVSNSQIAMSGWTSTELTKGAEARVNYAASTDQWQAFRSVGTSLASTGNADATDLDWSQMPVALVGIGGGTPGSQYLVSGAIIYEWVPSISFGLGAAGQDRPVARDTATLENVAKQVSKYGPMLVGTAVKWMSSGTGPAFADLMTRLSLNSNNSSVPRITY